MMDQRSQSDTSDLDRACGLLLASGRHALGADDPSAGLRCLLAAEALCALGARPVLHRIEGDTKAAAAIHEALALLGALPAELLELDPVLDALADAQIAQGLVS